MECPKPALHSTIFDPYYFGWAKKLLIMHDAIVALSQTERPDRTMSNLQSHIRLNFSRTIMLMPLLRFHTSYENRISIDECYGKSNHP